MESFIAHVKNGRLVLDEPTDLPEGEEVVLYLDTGDDIPNRDQLNAAIEESIRAYEAGEQGISPEELSRQLRALK